MRRTTGMIGIATLALTGFAACSEDSPTTQTPPPALQSAVITLTADSIILAPGDTGTFTASYTVPAGAVGESFGASGYPTGVAAFVQPQSSNSWDYMLIADPTAPPGSAMVIVEVAGGSGFIPASDSVYVEVTSP